MNDEFRNNHDVSKIHFILMEGTMKQRDSAMMYLDLFTSQTGLAAVVLSG
jgi:hypothetical protein